MSANEQLVLGIDVGGTNVKFGVVDPGGKIIARRRMSTRSVMSDPDQLTAALIAEVKALWAEAGLSADGFSGIGIGLPGLINPLDGVVIFLPNISGWSNVPLRKMFEDALGVRVFLENDVNLITLGEWQFGAGQGAADLICLTLGTGVGSGLILNGQLYRGAGFTAGELGHVPLNEEGPPCNCGGVACLESYIGNRALQRQAAAVFGREEIGLEEVTQAAHDGDERALNFWMGVGTRLGQGLIGVVNVLNPRQVVIGGGVAECHPVLFTAVEQRLRERAMLVQGRMARVVKARLGADAGIIGARVLVGQELL